MKTKIGKPPAGLHDAPTLILRKTKKEDATAVVQSDRKRTSTEVRRALTKFRETTVAQKIRDGAFSELDRDKKK